MKMSLQIWLIGSVVTDGLITFSMLYLVSSWHLAGDPLTDYFYHLPSWGDDAVRDVAFSVKMLSPRLCD